MAVCPETSTANVKNECNKPIFQLIRNLGQGQGGMISIFQHWPKTHRHAGNWWCGSCSASHSLRAQLLVCISLSYIPTYNNTFIFSTIINCEHCGFFVHHWEVSFQPITNINTCDNYNKLQKLWAFCMSLRGYILTNMNICDNNKLQTLWAFCISLRGYIPISHQHEYLWQ